MKTHSGVVTHLRHSLFSSVWQFLRPDAVLGAGSGVGPGVAGHESPDAPRMHAESPPHDSPVHRHCFWHKELFTDHEQPDLMHSPQLVYTDRAKPCGGEAKPRSDETILEPSQVRSAE